MRMIKPATEDDLESLSRLINSAYRGNSSRGGWTTEAELLDGTRTHPDLLKDIINTSGSKLLIYKDPGVDVLKGCVEIRKEGSRLYLGMLTVLPELQGQGIGKRLMITAEEEAYHLGCSVIYMSVLTDRSELIQWYVRHGYHDTGIKSPFSFSDKRFGVPKKPLEFTMLEKNI